MGGAGLFCLTQLPRAPRGYRRKNCNVDNILSRRSALGGKTANDQNADQFQKLMGVCYGVAGTAHLLDLLGPNMLPAMAGAPAFQELSAAGQLAALVWCATGPL